MKPYHKHNLTNEELNELVGGSWIENCIQSGASGGSNNVNTTAYCSCYYINSLSITNSNSAEYCVCDCYPVPNSNV